MILKLTPEEMRRSALIPEKQRPYQAELLALVAQGKDVWNEWVDANPDAKVDFPGIEFGRDVAFFYFRLPKNASFHMTTFSGDVDFRGATFSGDVDFRGATFSGDVGFNGATFSGLADFRGATFSGDVGFNGATFSGLADFRGATFSGDVGFSGATFSGLADFRGTTFSGDVDFRETTFSSSSSFCKTTFLGLTSFRGTTFSGLADFSETTFSGLAYFSETTFSESAYFSETTFSKSADFKKTTFSGLTEFSRTTFSGLTDFSETTFSGSTDFGEAKFKEAALFISVDVQVRIVFEGAEFQQIPDFHATKNTELIALGTVDFALPKPLGLLGRTVYWMTGLRGTDRSTMLRVRQIRGIAAKSHAIDSERDLTILERSAQVGSSWSDLKTLRSFNQWLRSLSSALFSTPLLLLYRWSSDYGRSIKRPLALLTVSPFFWYVIYLKLYIVSKLPDSLPLNSKKLSALQDIAVSSALPIGTALRPTYTSATQTLFGGSGALPLPFQIALLLQNVVSLILLFLIGLALRNYFRMK